MFVDQIQDFLAQVGGFLNQSMSLVIRPTFWRVKIKSPRLMIFFFSGEW
jgi:hypothetical protein